MTLQQALAAALQAHTLDNLNTAIGNLQTWVSGHSDPDGAVANFIQTLEHARAALVEQERKTD